MPRRMNYWLGRAAQRRQQEQDRNYTSFLMRMVMAGYMTIDQARQLLGIAEPELLFAKKEQHHEHLDHS